MKEGYKSCLKQMHHSVDMYADLVAPSEEEIRRLKTMNEMHAEMLQTYKEYLDLCDEVNDKHNNGLISFAEHHNAINCLYNEFKDRIVSSFVAHKLDIILD